MGSSCTIIIYDSNAKLWGREFERAELIQEAERCFGIEALGNQDFFFKETTFVDQVAQNVHFIGLRQLLLLGALFLDFFVMVGRQIGVLSFPELPDHPIKTFLGRIGVSRDILDKTKLYIKYWLINLNQGIYDKTESNYQINPDPYF